MRLARIDNGQFKIAIERRGVDGLPHDVKLAGGFASRP